MTPYVDVLVFLIAGATFPLVNVLVSKLLRRDQPYREKAETYESGEIPFGDARVKFHIHYYIFALIFLVFDVETVFLYPWAVVFRQMDPVFAFVEVFVFLLVLVVGLAYAWKKRVLRWI